MTVTETIPDKSRCLRQSSVAKRLETEKQRRQPRVKERVSKKYMSKYRRKTENAKERERMKKQNDVFEVISNFSILPLLERDIARESFLWN